MVEAQDKLSVDFFIMKEVFFWIEGSWR